MPSWVSLNTHQLHSTLPSTNSMLSTAVKRMIGMTGFTPLATIFMGILETG